MLPTCYSVRCAPNPPLWHLPLAPRPGPVDSTGSLRTDTGGDRPTVAAPSHGTTLPALVGYFQSPQQIAHGLVWCKPCTNKSRNPRTRRRFLLPMSSFEIRVNRTYNKSYSSFQVPFEHFFSSSTIFFFCWRLYGWQVATNRDREIKTLCHHDEG